VLVDIRSDVTSSNLLGKNVTSDKRWLLKDSYSATCNPSGHDKRKERKLVWVTENIAPVKIEFDYQVTSTCPLRGFITAS
jgi:hypothetical protein